MAGVHFLASKKKGQSFPTFQKVLLITIKTDWMGDASPSLPPLPSPPPPPSPHLLSSLSSPHTSRREFQSVWINPILAF